MQHSAATITEVCIPSNPNYLARLRRIVGCLADYAGMDTKEVHDAKLAVSEACANAIRHGSPRGEEDKINVKFSFSGGTVVTEITDPGDGFDPTNLPERAATQPGGYGLSLMKSLTDEVEFLKDGHGMTVRLVKTAKSPRRRRRLMR